MEFNATFLISTISFIAFIFIMNAILYKPVLKVMEERDNYIKANKDAADEHKKHAESLIEDKNNRISEAQVQSRDIVAAKNEAIKEERAKVLADAKNSTEKYFHEQKESLAAQKDDAVYHMTFDVKDLANKLTTRLMGEGVAFDPLSDNEIEEVIRENV